METADGERPSIAIEVKEARAAGAPRYSGGSRASAIDVVTRVR